MSFFQINKFKFLIGSILSCLVIVMSCKKDPVIPFNHVNNNWDIKFEQPLGWPSPVYMFTNNQLTKAGFILGRKLFYDTRLSRDNTISCASCHQAFSAFAHSDHNISHGVDGLTGIRNSPPIFNMNWHPSFFWDGGSNHIEVQPVAPITNPVEMDETMANALKKINADNKYHELTRNAFGVDTLNDKLMLRALAQFMGSMVSSNSRYDQYVNNVKGVTMSSTELAGKSVYEKNCASCHPAPLFSDFSFRNIGIRPSSANDSGRAHITLNAVDLYKFKVPSLRNLSYTAPYLHDGRAATIDDVLDQMEFDVVKSPTLDPLLENGIKLTLQERIELKAFLKTLDDPSFINDSRFHEPID